MNISRTDAYIRTNGTGFLVIMKLAEALFAGYLIVEFFLYRLEIKEMFDEYLGIYGTMGMRSYYQTYVNTIIGIIIGNIMLLFVDGIACVLVRLKGKGSAVVAFCHLIRFVFLSVVLLLLVVGTISRLSKTNSQLSSNDNLFVFLSLPFVSYSSVIYLIAIIERVVGLGIMAMYHLSVYRVMRYVSKECSLNELYVLKGKPYSLVFRAGNISIFIIIGVLVDLLFGKLNFGTILYGHAIFTEPVFMGFVNYNVASVIVLVFLVVKFLVVSGCARDFGEIHMFGEDDENYFAKVRSKETLKGNNSGSGQTGFQFAPADIANHNTIALVQQNPYRRWTSINVIQQDLKKHYMYLSNQSGGVKLELFAESIENIKDFKGITLTDASFSHCVFYRLDLTRTVFQNCDLNYSMFIECNTEKTTFPDSNMEGVQFQ